MTDAGDRCARCNKESFGQMRKTRCGHCLHENCIDAHTDTIRCYVCGITTKYDDTELFSDVTDRGNVCIFCKKEPSGDMRETPCGHWYHNACKVDGFLGGRCFCGIHFLDYNTKRHHTFSSDPHTVHFKDLSCKTDDIAHFIIYASGTAYKFEITFKQPINVNGNFELVYSQIISNVYERNIWESYFKSCGILKRLV